MFHILSNTPALVNSLVRLSALKPFDLRAEIVFFDYSSIEAFHLTFCPFTHLPNFLSLFIHLHTPPLVDSGIMTKAVREGDEYVINGGKMWTTSGTQADWICLLANTSDGPPHRNKSLICLPMNLPGPSQLFVGSFSCKSRRTFPGQKHLSQKLIIVIINKIHGHLETPQI